MGIGLVLIVSHYYSQSVMQQLEKRGQQAYIIGDIIKVTKRGEQVVWA